MSQEILKPVVLLGARSSHSLKLVSKHLDPYFKVLTADDAESTWESLLENRDISLLVAELALVIDKHGLLERLRNAGDSWLAATPLLLLVGENDTDEDHELAFQMGATDFINLPFASTELSARARLHANLYLQQQRRQSPSGEMQSVSAANLLQQLSQQNYFNSRVQQELSFSQRHRSSFSLCKLKLDNVKAIIAGFDKATAITAVKSIAQVIQQTLRREDSLCYLGNAEFCLLYPATNGIGATTAVNRIFEQVSGSEIAIAGKKVPVTLSGAVYSCIATRETELEKIFARLDASLTEARDQGGGRIVSSIPESAERVFSIDRTLKLIESGSTGDLSQHCSALMLTVLPLLEFADEALELGLETTNRSLRQQLESGAGFEEKK
jgi:diguanylate cyclase (GGDEF)-like protein